MIPRNACTMGTDADENCGRNRLDVPKSGSRIVGVVLPDEATGSLCAHDRRRPLRGFAQPTPPTHVTRAVVAARTGSGGAWRALRQNAVVVMHL